MKEVIETFFLLAGAQGILLAAFLFTKKENHTANIILALAVLCLSIELGYAAYYSKGWYRQYPHAMGIPYPFPFLYGPLFYFYAKLVSKKVEQLHIKDLLHGAPIILIYYLVSSVYFYNAAEKILFIDTMMMNVHPPLYSYIEAFIPIQGILYTILTIRVVGEYNSRIKNTYSAIELINLNWLKYLTIGMIVIWSIVAVQFFLLMVTDVDYGLNALLHLSISILIYSIGYKGLQQPEIFLPMTSVSLEPGKYQKSGLTEQDAEEIKQKLIASMREEKLFLDNELTLQKLSERLNISIHNLSEVINSKLNQSYYDFVNSYRLEDFKIRVVDPANDYLNILSIAFDSGFKSKGTFNAIFKKSTGMTPSEYKIKISQSTNGS